MATWVRIFAFLHMFPALSICSLWDPYLGISSPSSVNWPSDSYSWKICPEILTLEWTLTLMNQVLEGKEGPPSPDTFGLHNGKHFHSYHGHDLPLKSNLIDAWRATFSYVIDCCDGDSHQINVISSSDKKALLYLCSLSLETMRGHSNQNILLLCLHFQRR